MRKLQTILASFGKTITVPAGATHIEPSVFDRHICVQDKFDISSPAHYLLDCILADQAKAQRQGNKHVVLMGEDHGVPSNKALQSAVISLWSQRPSPRGKHDFMVAHELPYNRMMLEKSWVRAGVSAIWGATQTHSPVASASVVKNIAERGVDYFHIDASRRNDADGRSYIEADDQIAQGLYAASRRGRRFLDGELATGEALGMALRNQVHVKFVDLYMNGGGYKTACLLSGAAHLYGVKDGGIGYKETLAHLFRQSGYYVTPVIVDMGTASRYADQEFFSTPENKATTIVIDGLDNKDFCRDDERQYRGRRYEAKYLAKLQQKFANANDGLLPFPLPEQMREYLFYDRTVNYFVDAMRNEGLTDTHVQELEDAWHGRFDPASLDV